MRDPIRVLVVASVVFAVAGGLVLWSGVLNRGSESVPPTETVQLFPAAERWAGVRWSRIEEGVLSAPGASLHGVSSHGSWLVAWGDTPLPDPVEGGVSSAAVVWTSRGGLAWEQHELRLVTGERLLPQNLAVGPAGYLVYALRGPEDGVGLVAVSNDGEHWVEAGRPPFNLGGPLAATATGFVTIGLRAGEPTVLTTSDGAAWEQVTVPPQEGLFELSDVRRTTDGFVVAGRVERARDWEGVIWRSGPGGWDDLAANSVLTGPDRGVSVVRTVPFAGGILAMGSAGKVEDCAQLGGLVASLGPITADTCGGPPEAAWASPDGNRWQEVTLPRQGGRPDRGTAIQAISAGAAGVVALIEEAPLGVEQSVVGLWTSGDGVEWSRIGNGMPVGAGGLTGAMVGLPGRLIVFGGTGTGIAAWVGTPGG